LKNKLTLKTFYHNSPLNEKFYGVEEVTSDILLASPLIHFKKK
jgi:hypothetical protein